MAQVKTIYSLVHAADDLGILRAKIKELQDQAKGLENLLKESGETAVDGDLFHVSISHVSRPVTNWQKIAHDLGASKIRIAKNTRVSEYDTVKVSALKKNG